MDSPTQPDVDESMSDAKEEGSTTKEPQNFTPLHLHKRFPQPICTTSLCPTMDLVAFGLGNAATKPSPSISTSMADSMAILAESIIAQMVRIQISTSIMVNRTISWQRMLSIGHLDLSSVPISNRDDFQLGNNKSNDEADEKSDAPSGGTCLAWSPDGRIISIGLANGQVLHYDIENAASPGASPTFFYHLDPPPSSIISTITEIRELKQTPRSAKNASNFSPVVTRSMAARKKASTSTTPTRRRYSIDTDTPTREREGTPRLSTTFSSNTISIDESLRQAFAWKASSVVALSWHKVSPKHQDWISTDQEEQEMDSWSIQQHYLDRAKHFLPPCSYNDDMYRGDNNANASATARSENIVQNVDDTIDNYRPTCGESLSLLLVSTCANGFHIYLYGRYRILSIQSPLSISNVHGRTAMVCSNDLSSIILYSTTIQTTRPTSKRKGKVITVPALKLYRIPFKQQRINLQIIGASYSNIMSHLHAIRKGMDEVASSWKNAFRPLDMKFDQLKTLLLKYGVIAANQDIIQTASNVRMEMLNYILGGHSSRSADTSNAMDQFFTHPLMNDQLLQRLERTLESNVAGTEGVLRRRVLAPIRALIYDIAQLHGVVKVMNSKGDVIFEGKEDEEQLNLLMDASTSLRLHKAAEILSIIGEQSMSHVVESRFRLSSMIKWIRGTASSVKARGTAMDSVQRVNARKRRVSDSTLRRVANFLSMPLNSQTEFQSETPTNFISECILGVLLSDYFSKAKVYPTTLPSSSTYLEPKSQCQSETPSIRATLNVCHEIANELFSQPREAIEKSIIDIDIILEECFKSESQKIAIHKRIGSHKQRINDQPAFFASHGEIDDNSSALYKQRNWSIIANSCMSSSDGCELIQISCIPVDIDLEHSSFEKMVTSYLTTFLKIPKGHRLSGISFYGNDGNALKSETYETFKEGGQALGLHVQRLSDSPDQHSVEVVEELWLTEYDSLSFREVQNISQSRLVIQKYDERQDKTTLLHHESSIARILDDEECIEVKRRIIQKETKLPRESITYNSATTSSELFMSGNRGVGGIAWGDSCSLDLYDLEDDEDDEEGSEVY